MFNIHPIIPAAIIDGVSYARLNFLIELNLSSLIRYSPDFFCFRILSKMENDIVAANDLTLFTDFPVFVDSRPAAWVVSYTLTLSTQERTS